MSLSKQRSALPNELWRARRAPTSAIGSYLGCLRGVSAVGLCVVLLVLLVVILLQLPLLLLLAQGFPDGGASVVRGPPARAMGVGGGSAGVGSALMIPEGLVLMGGVGTHPWHLVSDHALNAHTTLTARKFLPSLSYAERHARAVLSHGGTGALARGPLPPLPQHIHTTPPKKNRNDASLPKHWPSSGGSLGLATHSENTSHASHCTLSLLQRACQEYSMGVRSVSFSRPLTCARRRRRSFELSL